MKRIEEFSDNDLIQELRGRFDHFVMAGRKDNFYGPNRAVGVRRWNGDCDVCIGLTHGISNDIDNTVWGIFKKDIRPDPSEAG